MALELGSRGPRVGDGMPSRRFLWHMRREGDSPRGDVSRRYICARICDGTCPWRARYLRQRHMHELYRRRRR